MCGLAQKTPPRRTNWQNLGFTALYTMVGLTLAATGVLAPVWAAAAQSLPDVVIIGNSARLLRSQSRSPEPPSARKTSSESPVVAQRAR